jgi:hypothetical protein
VSTLLLRSSLLLTLTLCSAAQQGSLLHVRGHITDASTRSPVAGVAVSTAQARHNAITDVNGFFSLELRDGTKPGDDVRIHIEKQGYRADDVTEAASESVTYPIKISQLRRPPAKNTRQGGPRPDMEADIVGSATGELEELQPTGTVVLDIDMVNNGPPSITKNWGLAVKLRNGEVFQGKETLNWITVYAQGDDRNPWKDFHPSDFIDQKTAVTPVPTGGRVRGTIAFAFVGIPREKINDQDTKIVLTFEDSRSRKYTTRYTIPTKVDYLVKPPLAEESQKSGGRMASVAWKTPAPSVNPWTFNVGYSNLGPFEAMNFASRIREDALATADVSDSKYQAKLRTQFLTDVQHSIAQEGFSSINLGVGQDRWDTLGLQDKNDADLILHGSKVVQIRGYAQWEDSSGKHEIDNCNWLQPPVLPVNTTEPQIPVWHVCQ